VTQRRILTGRNDLVAPFMERICGNEGGFVTAAGQGIGLVEFPDEGEPHLIAGVWFDGWNGANIYMHVAALPGRRWMTREYLWYVFHYAFEQCGVKRITGLVAETNQDARQFDEHIGFTLETRLTDACTDGDLLVYRMFKDECRWLKLGEKYGRK
jgi:hypothetical protein